MHTVYGLTQGQGSHIYCCHSGQGNNFDPLDILSMASARQTWSLVIEIAIISCKGVDIMGKGTQQPIIVKMLKKFQSAAGSDPYRTCLVISIFICQVYPIGFSYHFSPSFKITMLIVFCTPIWNQEMIISNQLISFLSNSSAPKIKFFCKIKWKRKGSLKRELRIGKWNCDFSNKESVNDLA